jgi:hypothetical protein
MDIREITPNYDELVTPKIERAKDWVVFLKNTDGKVRRIFFENNDFLSLSRKELKTKGQNDSMCLKDKKGWCYGKVYKLRGKLCSKDFNPKKTFFLSIFPKFLRANLELKWGGPSDPPLNGPLKTWRGCDLDTHTLCSKYQGDPRAIGKCMERNIYQLYPTCLKSKLIKSGPCKQQGKKLCPYAWERSGYKAILGCMFKNSDKLSKECRNYVLEKSVVRKFKGYCKSDIGSFCSPYKGDRKKLISCLGKKFDELRPRCKRMYNFLDNPDIKDFKRFITYEAFQD